MQGQLKDETASLVRHAGRDKVTYIVIFLLMGLGITAFATLADRVIENEPHAFDRSILLSFRHENDPSQTLGPPWVDEAVRDVTALGSTTVLTLVTLGVTIYLLLIRKYYWALITALSVVTGLLVSQGCKAFFSRPRPDVVPHAMEVFTASFPSGHSMLSAVVYLTLGVLIARVQESRLVRSYVLGLAIFLSIIVGLSRIYLGVHWPTDVIAGWSLGSAWALLWWLIATEVAHRTRWDQR